MVARSERVDGEESEQLLANEIVPNGAGGSVVVVGGDDDDNVGVSVDVALERIGFGRFQYGLCAALGWALSADAIETLAVSFLLPFAMCELQATSLDKGALSAVGFAGMLVGSLFWGAIADGIGRQRALLWCQSMNALFSVASSFSQSFQFLIFTRLLSGIGVGGTLPLLSVYFIEFLPPQKRGRWMGFYLCFWMIGQFLVSGLAWAILPRIDWSVSAGWFRFNSWRMFLLLCSAPCLTSALMFIAFPESPRYLIQKGRTDEAMKVLRRMYVGNCSKGRNLAAAAFPTFVLAPALPSATPAAATTRHLAGVTGFLKEVATRMRLLFTDRRHRRPFLLGSAIFFCIGFSSYGLGMWFPEIFKRFQQGNGTSVCSAGPSQNAPPGKPGYPVGSECGDKAALVEDAKAVFFDSFLQAIATLPGNVCFLLIIGLVARKVVLSASFIISSSTVFFIWLVKSHAAGVAVSMVFTAINIINWNSITLITPELFSTDVRSTAQGMLASMIRLASIVANVMIGALIDVQCSAMMLLLGGLLVIGGILSAFLPNPASRSVAEQA